MTCNDANDAKRKEEAGEEKKREQINNWWWTNDTMKSEMTKNAVKDWGEVAFNVSPESGRWWRIDRAEKLSRER